MPTWIPLTFVNEENSYSITPLRWIDEGGRRRRSCTAVQLSHSRTLTSTFTPMLKSRRQFKVKIGYHSWFLSCEYFVINKGGWRNIPSQGWGESCTQRNPNLLFGKNPIICRGTFEGRKGKLIMEDTVCPLWCTLSYSNGFSRSVPRLRISFILTTTTRSQPHPFLSLTLLFYQPSRFRL